MVVSLLYCIHLYSILKTRSYTVWYGKLLKCNTRETEYKIKEWSKAIKHVINPNVKELYWPASIKNEIHYEHINLIKGLAT